jgi:beta-glucosidase
VTDGDRIRWGAATTASGSLGVAPRSDWGGWQAEGRLPASGDGAGMGEAVGEDLALAAELGLGSLRWTIDWARLEPRQGQWDTGFADFVTEVLRAARAAGIDVWAVLHDGPLPGWFADDERGFRDPDGLRRTWPRHVDRVAEAFGDLVAAWVPVLDPFTIAADGDLEGRRPPGRTAERGFLDALTHVHRASYEALRLLRSGDPLVACCIDIAPVHPGVRTREPDERDAARARAETVNRLRFGTWVRALNDGVLSIPGRAEVELEGLAGGYDVVGFTHRGEQTVHADGSVDPYPADAAVAADGRSPWAEGIGVAVRRIADEIPRRRLALLGTGLTDASDAWRAELVDDTDAQLRAAVADGVPVTDAFWESLVDGWTPECGLEVPTGVVDGGRDPRPSAESLRSAAIGRERLAP